MTDVLTTEELRSVERCVQDIGEIFATLDTLLATVDGAPHAVAHQGARLARESLSQLRAMLTPILDDYAASARAELARRESGDTA